MAARVRLSAKEKDREDALALGPDRVPENQKREVYERVRRAMDAKSGPCTSHKVGSSPWDKNEQRVLEDGLRYYPHERHSNMLIYIRIAASLPKKTVRDVAHHLRHMQDEHKAKMEAAAGMNPAKRHHPDPAAAAAMAAMHEHQMAAMFAANAAAGMAAMHTLPGLAQGLSGPGGPGPHLKDEKVEARVCILLQENMAIISSIRENMVMGRFLDNHSLMIAFDKNVKEVTTLLATLPFAEMQKLPVQINPYFITGLLPPGMGPQQPGSPTHHLHVPPGAPRFPVGGPNIHGNGNGHVGQAAARSVEQSVPPTATSSGGAPAPQPIPPSFAAPPVITPAAQQPQPQPVPDATEVMAAAKAAAVATVSAVADGRPDAPVPAPSAMDAAAGAADPPVELSGEVGGAGGGGGGGDAYNGSGDGERGPPPENLGVALPGA